MEYTICQGDTLPVLSFICTDSGGNDVDISAATLVVRFSALPAGTADSFNGSNTPSVGDATNIASYQLAATDTESPGKWQVMLRATWGENTQSFFANCQNGALEVLNIIPLP